MRHLKRKRNLGISPSHRSSLLTNLAVSILDKERIITTVAKAKEVRGLVERLITYGKRGDLHAIRLAARYISDKTLLHKLFTDIAPSFKEREGGYTRIIKLGERKGDNAPTAFIELTGRQGQELARQRKKKRKQGDAATPASKEAASPAETEKSAPVKAPKPKKEKTKEKDSSEKSGAVEQKEATPETPKEKKPAVKKKKADKE